VSAPHDDAAAKTLRAAVDPTATCVPLERLEGPLTRDEQDHIATCPRCQTELSLLEQFDSSTPARDEGAAVPWIVSELRRRRAGEAGESREARVGSGWLAGLRWRPLGLAAGVLVAAVVVGYIATDREPQLRDDTSTNVGYRTEQISVVAPVGDVAVAPSELTWLAVPAAERYDIEVLQVDRTRLWRASSPVPHLALPASVIAQLAPGKTVIWEVNAVNASGTVIAVSGTQRFRVTP
jgi:hypothetical protein